MPAVAAALVERRPRAAGAVSSEVFGMVTFVISEAMLFIALIASNVVMRGAYSQWPPLGQPRLPIEATAVNTLVLLGSAWAMHQAVLAARSRDATGVVRWLGVTLLAGSAFLVAQGYEWVGLIRFGMTLSSSVYGGLFYTTVGAHGLHVLGALLVVAWGLFRSIRGGYADGNPAGLEAIRVLWWFVVGVWPVLYAVVYLW